MSILSCAACSAGPVEKMASGLNPMSASSVADVGSDARHLDPGSGWLGWVVLRDVDECHRPVLAGGRRWERSLRLEDRIERDCAERAGSQIAQRDRHQIAIDGIARRVDGEG